MRAYWINLLLIGHLNMRTFLDKVIYSEILRILKSNSIYFYLWNWIKCVEIALKKKFGILDNQIWCALCINIIIIRLHILYIVTSRQKWKIKIVKRILFSMEHPVSKNFFFKATFFCIQLYTGIFAVSFMKKKEWKM